jgi:2,4-diaminopentanoate dehydrogenase
VNDRWRETCRPDANGHSVHRRHSCRHALGSSSGVSGRRRPVGVGGLLPGEDGALTRPYRLIIWGPGEIGGATLRAAHASDKFEVVGVKVFSRHKHGKDAGELVGIGPIGLKATCSKEEILALDADCAIVTPQPRSVFEGLDADVIDLLESGKSVVSTAAYHNVAMPNWFNQARSPTSRLREIARTPGAAVRVWERSVLAIARALTSFRSIDPVTDVLLRPLIDRRVPARASADRLLAACRKGRSSLHGTGVHPTFMVERQLMRMCRALSHVSHIHFTEAGDFAGAPEGMWGGLERFGFGRHPRELGDDWVVARTGDFYYGDLIGNVAHALYGARPDDVRVERAMRGIPAVTDLQFGSTLIRAGTTAALHITHRGYVADHHFFTNEECWYLGAENACHGDAVSAGALPPHGGWAFAITGEPTAIRGHIAAPALREGSPHPITIMSVNALLDSVEQVCNADPGILIDDAHPRYRHQAAATSRGACRPLSRRCRVAIWGSDDLSDAVMQGAQRDRRYEVSAVESPDALLAANVDCVVVTSDPRTPAADIESTVLALLEAGKNVVSRAAVNTTLARLEDACRCGGTSCYRIGLHSTLMISRMVMTMVQGLSSVHHIRIVEIIDVSSSPAESTTLELSAELAQVIATVARDLYDAAETDVRIECTRRQLIERDVVVAICTIDRGYLADHHFFTSEQWRHVSSGASRLPHYTIHIEADPADLESQWVFEPCGGVDDLSTGCVGLVLDAIGPVCAAEPGVLIEDARPRYKHDERIAEQTCPVRVKR